MYQFRNFARNQSGATAIVFGLALVPVVGAAGIAVDYSRAGEARQALQNAVDSAALAAVVDRSRGRQTDIQSLVGAAVTKIAHLDNLKVTGRWSDDGRNLEVTASGQVRTVIGQLSGTSIEIATTGEATLSGGGSSEPNEFVFAFDTTASMTINGCFSCAVATLTQTLQSLRLSSAPGSFSAAFIPFSDRVRIGTSRGSWLSGPVPAGWNGCVEPREEKIGANIHGLTDRTPSQLGFRPTAPGQFISNLGSIYPGGAPFCPSQTMLPPGTPIGDIERAMTSMTTGGTGRYDEAMAWAWRLVSPQWQGAFGSPGLPAAKGKGKKTVVVLTDGYTEAYRHEVGGPAGNIFGNNLGSRAGFENFVRVCDAMRAQGVEVHVIFTRTGNSSFEPFGRACAAQPDRFHVVGDAPALASVFKRFGLSTGTARLIR
jgi:Flp pilus assembly protein TadG